MNKEELNIAVSLLRSFSDGKLIFDTENGMCCNLFFRSGLNGIAEELRVIYHEIITTWPKYSGSRTYPVPHPEFDSAQAYNIVINLWDVTEKSSPEDKEYINNRKELCIFFADYLTEHYLGE